MRRDQNRNEMWKTGLLLNGQHGLLQMSDRSNRIFELFEARRSLFLWDKHLEGIFLDVDV